AGPRPRGALHGRRLLGPSARLPPRARRVPPPGPRPRGPRPPRPGAARHHRVARPQRPRDGARAAPRVGARAPDLPRAPARLVDGELLEVRPAQPLAGG